MPDRFKRIMLTPAVLAAQEHCCGRRAAVTAAAQVFAAVTETVPAERKLANQG